MPQRVSLGRGLVERIGELKGRITQKTTTVRLRARGPGPASQGGHGAGPGGSHRPRKGDPCEASTEITGVGHRVVHGGEQYASSVVIDDDVLKAIEKNVELAPLHNPPNLIGIQEAQAVLPDVEAGGRLRHRVPPDHARRPPTSTACPTSCTRSTRSAATASTAPAIATSPAAPWRC